CGIMDQFASGLGQRDHLLLIDCQSQETELVPFHSPDLSVLVANTMVGHDLASGEYRKRREETEQALTRLSKESWREVNPADLETLGTAPDNLLFRRARHVVSEISRTRKAAEALRQGNYAALGPLMNASHRSLRDDFEVSCRDLDLMVEIAEEIGPPGGVLGTRMTGGGFGGSTVTLCRSAQLPEIAARLSMDYEEETDRTPQLFSTRPVQGARLL
ncbi:MAG: galactokinase, partial [Verrucomicrobiota bacterium]|nr:galactokinase [Verrucomicrobiota bacterium]